MPKRKKTFATVLESATDLQERAAVHRRLASYLRTNFLDRDSSSAVGTISAGRGTVGQHIIEDVAIDLEEGAKSMESEAANILSEEV